MARRMQFSVVGLPHYTIWHLYEPSVDDIKHMEVSALYIVAMATLCMLTPRCRKWNRRSVSANRRRRRRPRKPRKSRNSLATPTASGRRTRRTCKTSPSSRTSRSATQSRLRAMQPARGPRLRVGLEQLQAMQPDPELASRWRNPKGVPNLPRRRTDNYALGPLPFSNGYTHPSTPFVHGLILFLDFTLRARVPENPYSYTHPMHTGKDVPGWVLVSLTYPDGKKKRSDNIMYTTKDRLLGGRVIMAEAFGGYSGKPAGVLNALRAAIFCPNYKKVYFLFILLPRSANCTCQGWDLVRRLTHAKMLGLALTSSCCHLATRDNVEIIQPFVARHGILKATAVTTSLAVHKLEPGPPPSQSIYPIRRI